MVERCVWHDTQTQTGRTTSDERDDPSLGCRAFFVPSEDDPLDDDAWARA